MTEAIRALAGKLCECHSLSLEEYAQLIDGRDAEAAALLAGRADAVRRQTYGNRVFIRGLIEISNICKNDCLYCGIRRSNAGCALPAWEGRHSVLLRGGLRAGLSHVRDAGRRGRFLHRRAD